MNKVFNWGIVGLGRIAHKFAEDLGKIPNARLHAVASRDLDRSRQFGQQYSATHFYGSYEELASCPDLDAVYIATPHVSHCSNTVFFLQHRIPVLCEKPFAMNATEVRQMIAAAAENQTFLMEAIWTRFLPMTLKVLELINNGQIGKVLSVKADFGFRAPLDPENRIYNRELGGGALLDIGIYPVFLSLLLLGKPETIKALAHIGSTGVDEDTAINFKYADGAMAHLHATIRSGTKTEAFIFGETGTLHLHSRWHEPSFMTLLRENERPEFFGFDYFSTGYNYEAVEVMRCLEQGLTESPDLPLSFSLLLIETLDAIRSEIGLVYPNHDVSQ
jgi:predicted dehydrogenase